MGAFDGLREGQTSHGYWGNHTSSIDWCEDNYAQTPYIAEFVNTLTNLPVIIYGIWAAFATVSGGVNKRYSLLYLGLSFIGVGSFGFHASLRWEWQLLDELPMIYVVSYSAYLVMDTLPSFKLRFGIWGPMVLLSWDVFVTLSYMYMPNPVYHQIAFAVILLTTIARNVILLQRIPPDHPAKAQIQRTMLSGVVTFASAFAIWNVDNIYCTELKNVKIWLRAWAFLLEGHAIWHILTGYGSFLIFAAAIYLQLAIKVSPDAFTFDSKAWFPVVRATLPSSEKKAVGTRKQRPRTQTAESVPEKSAEK